MIKRIYGTYRPKRFGQTPFNSVTLNGIYHPSYFLAGMFADWEQAGLTKTVDGGQAIPESRYTASIAPGVPKLTRFMYLEYNELYVDPVELTKSIKAVGAEFQVDPFLTTADAIVWIKANTDLVETAPGVFIISNEYTDPILGVVPKVELTIL